MVGIRLEGEVTNTGCIPNEEYTIPIPVLGKLAEALVLRQNEREADLAMANIKDRMEG